MSVWPVVALGSKVRFFSGGTPRKDEAKYWNGDIPWVGSAEMVQRRIYDTELHVTEDGAREGSRLVPANTVLVVVRGMSLAKEFRVAITARELTFNQDLKALRPAADLDAVFLFYYLLSQNSAIRDSASEAAHGTKKLDMPVLEQWPIPLPPMEVQRKIAAILAAYDDLIANNQRRMALLESMAEEIYREWFVRMRFPGHQEVPRFKGLPSSWTLKSFKDFCVLKRGYDLPDSNMQPGDYPVIASTSIKGFHNEFKVNPPVITTGRSGSLGTVLLVNKKSWPLNTALYVKDFCGNSPFLIYHTLRSLKLETFNVGAGVPTLNRNHLSSLGIAVPDAALQRQFDAVLRPMNAQASTLVQVNEKLTAQRDALLPRLISGKLKVDQLDIQLPPSMKQQVTD
jgi:type I restriction enzyme, S subunit